MSVKNYDLFSNISFGVCCVFTFNSEASTISQNATYFSNAKNNGDARHWSYELSDYIQGNHAMEINSIIMLI